MVRKLVIGTVEGDTSQTPLVPSFSNESIQDAGHESWIIAQMEGVFTCQARVKLNESEQKMLVENYYKNSMN